MDEARIFILIVTYREMENLVHLVPTLLEYDYQVVVVDDNSPDGSPDWLNNAARENSRLTAIIRRDERGYGSALLAGLDFISRQAADFIITLDADFSHDPAEIPALVAK